MSTVKAYFEASSCESITMGLNRRPRKHGPSHSYSTDKRLQFVNNIIVSNHKTKYRFQIQYKKFRRSRVEILIFSTRRRKTFRSENGCINKKKGMS